MAEKYDARPIGVFDSGLGGISVLRELRAHLPRENYVYYGDNANAPYGVRTEDEIRELSWAVVRKLLAFDIKALVIGCNTATAAAVKSLRAALDIPILGIEPAIKPAALHAPGKRVLVLATEATLRLEKFQALKAIYCPDAICVPSPELVKFVERGVFSGEELDGYLSRLLAPHKGENTGAAVLGCTHFIFLREAISRHLPGIPLFDGNGGIANHLEHVLAEKGLLDPEGEGRLELYTSGDPEHSIPLMRALLER